MYFRQCSLLVTAGDLAVMAATLANGGINPVTGSRGDRSRRHGARALDHGHLRHVRLRRRVAVCGSGCRPRAAVSGGLVAASPGQFGIGLFSPPLDDVGNSVRAVAAGEDHLRALRPAPDARADPAGAPGLPRADGERTHSSRTRRRAERAALDAAASTIAIRGIGGDLEFAEAEILVRSGRRRAGRRADAPASALASWLVLDLHRVTRVHPAARKIIAGLIGRDPRAGRDRGGGRPGRGLRPRPRAAALRLARRGAGVVRGLAAGADSTRRSAPTRPCRWPSTTPWPRLTRRPARRWRRGLEIRQLTLGEGVLAKDGELVAAVLSGRLGVYAPTAPGQEARRAGSLGPGTAITQVRLVNRPGGAQRLRAELPSRRRPSCAPTASPPSEPHTPA